MSKAALLGTALLSSSAFAMTELAQGYALAASAPPVTGKAAVPPPAEPAPPAEKQAARPIPDFGHATLWPLIPCLPKYRKTPPRDRKVPFTPET